MISGTFAEPKESVARSAEAAPPAAQLPDGANAGTGVAASADLEYSLTMGRFTVDPGLEEGREAPGFFTRAVVGGRTEGTAIRAEGHGPVSTSRVLMSGTRPIDTEAGT